MAIEIPMPKVELPKPKPPVIVKSTFKVIEVSVTTIEPTTVSIGGNFLDILSSSTWLGNIMISINDGDWVRIDRVLPVVMNVEKIALKSTTDCTVTLLVGVGDIIRTGGKVEILTDWIGLAKDSTLVKVIDALGELSKDSTLLKAIDAIEQLSKEETLSKFRHTTLANVVNTPISANTKVFPKDLEFAETRIARIYACLNASGVLSVVRTVGDTILTEALNSGNPLNANCAYIFDVLVDQGEKINLMYSANATINKLAIYGVT